MARAPYANSTLQKYGAGAADCHHDQLLLADYIICGSHGLLDPNIAAAPPHDVSLHQHHGSDCTPSCRMLPELPVCNVRPGVFQRSPSLIGFVASPDDFATASDHLSTVQLDGFNAESDYCCTPLERQESFKFSLINDQINLWDAFDEFNHGVSPGAVFQDALASPVSVMDVCNNENALAHNFVDQVSQLETMVSNDSVGLEHVNQSKLPGLQSPISCPTSSPTYMEGNMVCRGDQISDPMNANLVFSNATSTSTCLYQTPNLHLQALISPTSSHGVEDMGSVHGGNQAATRRNKTELDRLAWRKHGQAGGIKAIKQPRSTSLAVRCRVGIFEDMDPIYDGNEVRFSVKTDNITLDDGFGWFKYGQKPIVNHKHPRSYLKCVESARSGCKALKRVQRCSHHEEYVEFRYLGRHNHSHTAINK